MDSFFRAFSADPFKPKNRRRRGKPQIAQISQMTEAGQSSQEFIPTKNVGVRDRVPFASNLRNLRNLRF
jgi:hypothetical protein